MTAQERITEELRQQGETLRRIEGMLGLIVAAPEQGGRLVDADWIAKRYGKRREWVYRNKDRLGAQPLGSGPRPRPLFDPVEVDRAIRGGGKTAPTARRRRRRPQAPAYYRSGEGIRAGEPRSNR